MIASTYLPGWDYLDTYSAEVATHRPRCAMAAAECLLARSPGAVRVLALRDLLTRVASLKPAVPDTTYDLLLPVVHASEDLVVLGCRAGWTGCCPARDCRSAGNFRVACRPITRTPPATLTAPVPTSRRGTGGVRVAGDTLNRI